MELFSLERFSSNVAVWFERTEITYSQLANIADDSARNLHDDDLVAIECVNHPQVIGAYIGCQRRRVPTLLVAAELPPILRESLYERYQVSAVFSASDQQWHRRKVTSPMLHPDLGVLLSTSGSTGASKLVRLSHRNLASNASAIATYLILGETNRSILNLPMHYAYGLSIVHSTLISGGTLIISRHSIMEKEFWSCMLEAQVNLFSGVPVMYELLVKMRLDRMELPALKTLTQAGGRLSPSHVEWISKVAWNRGWQFYVMYGQTEATARMAYLPSEFVREHTSSIGVAIPGGSLSIIDNLGNTVIQSGVVGQLVYQGDNVMMGYATDESDLALGDVNKGVLITGDLAETDTDGLFYLRGRESRMIKLYGIRLDLDHLEGELLKNDINAVVTSFDNKLILAGENESSLKRAIDFFVSEFHFQRGLIISLTLESLPRTMSGKISYHEIVLLSGVASANR